MAIKSHKGVRRVALVNFRYKIIYKPDKPVWKLIGCYSNSKPIDRKNNYQNQSRNVISRVFHTHGSTNRGACHFSKVNQDNNILKYYKRV